jgi:hypothetical protein
MRLAAERFDREELPLIRARLQVDRAVEAGRQFKAGRHPAAVRFRELAERYGVAA